MSGLTLFGLFGVTAMLLCCAFEERSPKFSLAFAAACALASIYGFLQGAWRFAIVEAIGAAVALGRGWRTDRTSSARDRAQVRGNTPG